MQSRPTDKAAIGSVEDGEYPVLALEPLSLEEPQALLGLRPLQSADEPRNVRVVVEGNELVDVRRPKRTQKESLCLDDHERSVTWAKAPGQRGHTAGRSWRTSEGAMPSSRSPCRAGCWLACCRRS